MHASDLLRAVKASGGRVTKTRKTMAELFTASEMPVSATEILSYLEKKNIAVNRTTVYRELAFFEKGGVIQKVDFGDGVRRYELTEREHHHHLICVSCKKVKDVQLKGDLESQEKSISRRTGFKILNHSLEFFGLCASCK
jgi:Fur family ferric uptake transcriptional regulator